MLFWCACLFVIPQASGKGPDYGLDDDGTAKRKNDLSREHIQTLREAFIGREFVLRINWHANQLIHDGEVRHHWETMLNSSGRKRVERGEADYGPLVSPAGEVSSIIGMNFMHPNDVYLHFRTPRGTKGSLVVRSTRRKSTAFNKWKNEILTIPWLEDQLTNQTVYFLKKSKGLNPNAVRASLPQAQSGLQLSNSPIAPVTSDSGSVSSISMFPTYLESVVVRAEPSEVRRGESVKLILEYKISGKVAESIEAKESRYLSFGQKSLPGYPVIKSFSRATGANESFYRQKVPPSANTGIYEYRGEVCVNGECISRIVRIKVSD